MKEKGLESTFDRYEEQQPQCGFGTVPGFVAVIVKWDLVMLTRLVVGAKMGVCGADANTIAARFFLRAVAAGCAAHSDHGRSVAHLFIATARGEAPGYINKR